MIIWPSGMKAMAVQSCFRGNLVVIILFWSIFEIAVDELLQVKSDSLSRNLLKKWGIKKLPWIKQIFISQ